MLEAVGLQPSFDLSQVGFGEVFSAGLTQSADSLASLFLLFQQPMTGILNVPSSSMA